MRLFTYIYGTRESQFSRKFRFFMIITRRLTFERLKFNLVLSSDRSDQFKREVNRKAEMADGGEAYISTCTAARGGMISSWTSLLLSSCSCSSIHGHSGYVGTALVYTIVCLDAGRFNLIGILIA